MRLSPSALLSLLVVSAGSGTLIHAWDWRPDVPVWDIGPAPIRPDAVPITGGTEDADIAARDSAAELLRQRPPFTPGRRPYTPAIVEEAAPPMAAAAEEIPVPAVHGI